MMRPMRKLILVLLVVLTATACGGGGSSSSPTSPTATTPPTTTAPPANANVAGIYVWSVRNSPACPTFSRDWAITITQSGTTLAVATPTLFQGLPFTGIVSGNSVSFPSVQGGSINVLEGFTGGTTPTGSFTGQMSGTASGTTISGNLTGQLGPGLQGCNAANHTFTMTRQ